MVKNNDMKYWVEKYFLHHIDDINNIDKLKIKNNRNDLDLINIKNLKLLIIKKDKGCNVQTSWINNG